MKKFIIAALIALSVGGCALLKSYNNPATVQDLATVEAGYGAALSIANGYKQACVAGKIPASCLDVVKRLQGVESYAYAELKVAREFVKKNPSIDASVVLGTAKGAVQAFKDAMIQNGVK